MSGVSRREVLRIGVAGAGAGAGLVAGGAGAMIGQVAAGAATTSTRSAAKPAVVSRRTSSARTADRSAPQLHVDRLDALVGSAFTIWIGRERRHVKLLKLKRHHVAGEGSDACFSLIFSAPHPVLPSGTYRFSHPKLGRFALFVSPVGRPAAGQRYEAVVNHE